LIFNWKF
jgi:growth arrest-specific protein 8